MDRSTPRLERKWKEIGKDVGKLLGTPKYCAIKLKEGFDKKNLSPKNTFLEIENFCLKEGLTDRLRKEIESDSDRIYGLEVELRSAFSSACAWELVKRWNE